jgi:hypothetical protein
MNKLMNNTNLNWNADVNRLVAWDYIGKKRIVYDSCNISPGSTVFQIQDNDQSYIGRLKSIVIEDGDPDGKWIARGKILIELPSSKCVTLTGHVSKAPCGFDGPQLYELFIEPLAKPSETRPNRSVANLSESFTIHALT